MATLTIEAFCSQAITPPGPPHHENIWVQQFYRITSPRDGLCHFDETARRYHALVMGYLMKCYLGWTPSLKMPSGTKQGKEEIKAAAAVAHSFIELLNELQLLNYLPSDKHQAEWFGDAILEYELLGTVRLFAYKREDEVIAQTERWRVSVIPECSGGKDSLVASMRAENQMLWTLRGNPFRRHSAKTVFDKALTVANIISSDVDPNATEWAQEVMAKKIRAFVKARRTLAKVLASKDASRTRVKMNGDGILVPQGGVRQKRGF